MSFILQDVPQPKCLEILLASHAGESYQEIAVRFGARANIVGRIIRHWIPSEFFARRLIEYSGPRRHVGGRNLPPRERKAVVDAVLAHPELSYVQIAAKLGVPSDRVYRLVTETPSLRGARGHGYHLRRNAALGLRSCDKKPKLKPRSRDPLVNEWEQILSDAGLGMARGERHWILYGDPTHALAEKYAVVKGKVLKKKYSDY